MPLILLFKGAFGFIFKDWRITLLIAILAVCGFLGWKYTSVQRHLAETAQALKVEQDNNATLRGNLDLAVKTNEENVQLLEQLRKDNKITREQLVSLNNMIAGRNRQIDDLKKQLANKPGAPLTENIRFTVDSIQKMREAKQ